MGGGAKALLDTHMRKYMMLLTAMAGLTAPLSANAQTIEEQVISELEGQGYTDIQIYHTLLGRLRIVATSGDIQRELVILPASGEVLRDHSSRVSPARRSGEDGTLPPPPPPFSGDRPDLPDRDDDNRPERPDGDKPEREERKN